MGYYDDLPGGGRAQPVPTYRVANDPNRLTVPGRTGPAPPTGVPGGAPTVAFGGAVGGGGGAPDPAILRAVGNILGGGAQSGTQGTLPGAPPLTSVAQKDPRVEETAKKLSKRTQTLETQEGQMDPFLMESITNLRQRMSADPTRRAIERQGTAVGDWAAGMGERSREAAARSGRGAGFGGSAIESAAQRLQAKGAADISLGRERDLDQLAIAGQGILSAPSQLGLARTGLTQGAYGMESGFAPIGAQLGLEQQGLGLQQWQAAQDAAYKQGLLRQGGVDSLIKLLAASGYA